MLYLHNHHNWRCFILKALGLFSGGLDSQLAAFLLKDQGIEVEAVHFMTPFFGMTDRNRKAADALGIKLHCFDISDDYMEILRNPRYGYGKNFNPCIDCHAYMIKRTGELLESLGAGFVFTGEVLGQRPMSQNRNSLDLVARLSGYPDRLLRPLSALCLPITPVEEAGMVDRTRLLDIRGRSRLRQMELAEQWGIRDYPSPAGGCLLTTENYAARLSQLFRIKPSASAADAEIIKHGRVFILPHDMVMVVGRKHAENEALSAAAQPSDHLLKVADHSGPTAVIRSLSGEPVPQEVLLEGAAITARYSDADSHDEANIKIWHPGFEPELITVRPVLPADTPRSI